jgi:hypothetical protein
MVRVSADLPGTRQYTRASRRPAATVERGGVCMIRTRYGLFAVAAMWGMACGGGVTSAADSGPTSGGEDASGPPSVVGVSSGTAGSSGGGSFAGPPMSGSSTSSGADAAPTTAVDAAVVRCNGPGAGGGGAGGGGSGSPGSCSGFAQETCSGVSYSVSCACPQGTCACQGPSSTFVAFPGCPVCPTSPEQLFAACGFRNSGARARSESGRTLARDASSRPVRHAFPR